MPSCFSAREASRRPPAARSAASEPGPCFFVTSWRSSRRGDAGSPAARAAAGLTRAKVGAQAALVARIDADELHPHLVAPARRGPAPAHFGLHRRRLPL